MRRDQNIMRKPHLLLLVFLALYSLGSKPQFPTSPGVAEAAPAIFSSPINAACIRVSPTVCKLHVDPFMIQIAPGNQLAAFQLKANNSLLYDFRTDVSNPPSGDYTPSSVKLDFAASCGTTYTINLLARDSGDTDFLNAGQVEEISCPVGSYTIMLPLMVRPQ
jgi:hypothetical protein